MDDLYTLYGMAGSLYTARPRSYMRVNGVPFVEVKAGGPVFTEEVVPKVGRWIIPVMRTPDGELVQDGADIIDYLDRKGFSRNPIYPQDDVLLAMAHVFELYGSHGLLRPAMHYRWNFDRINLPFLRDTFRDVLPDGLSDAEEDAAFEHGSGRMRKATRAFGVEAATHDAVEESYTEFLALLDAHLRDHPFMLGGHPTIADYGLIGAMYAHLARDPAPLHLMQTTAPRVFRWVERMNMAEDFVDEPFARAGGRLIDSDALPGTLLSLLRFIAQDYLPEIVAHIGRANDWLREHPEVGAGAAIDAKSMFKGLGMAAFEWRGHRIETVVVPYRFYLLQRLHDAIDKAGSAARAAIGSLFVENGLDPLLQAKTVRRMERSGHQEVWGTLV